MVVVLTFAFPILGSSQKPLAAAVLLFIALVGPAAELPVEAATRSARSARRQGAIITRQDDGSLAVQGTGYRALIGADGNLHSLSVGDTEMLDDRVAISLGCFFYSGGPRRLNQVTQRGHTTIEATDGVYSARYRFTPSSIGITLTNSSAKPVPYFVVLSPAIIAVTRQGSAEAAAVPANERWGAARFAAQTGAYIELTGGTRVWGPWLQRQVWEVSQVPAGGKLEIGITVGTGPPPRPALEQLIGLRASVLPESGIVDAGNPIEMVVTLDNRSGRDLQGALSVELSAFRGDVVIFSTSSLDMPAQRVAEKAFRWQVNEPDFYTMRVTATSSGRQLAQVRAVAGYEPSKILPQVERPADFDQFWQRLVAEAARQPQYILTRTERLSHDSIDVWVAQYESVAGKVISGWFVAPTNAHGLPAILYLSGFGARPIQPPVGLAAQGWVVLAIDIRGNRMDRVHPRPFEDYSTEGIESPETYVYREIVGHAIRGIEFLRSREEVDPQRIAVVGVSEGGGVGLIAASVSASVRAVAADAPMLVDFPLSLRSADWPYTGIARYMTQRPHSAPGVSKTLSYFDVINASPQLHCPVLLSIGLLDRVSLPAAVYGLYNVLPGPKEIRTYPLAGHEGGGEDHWAYTLDWLSKAVAAR